MLVLAPGDDIIYDMIKVQFDTSVNYWIPMDVGMSLKDIAYEVLASLPEDEYDNDLYLHNLLNAVP